VAGVSALAKETRQAMMTVLSDPVSDDDGWHWVRFVAGRFGGKTSVSVVFRLPDASDGEPYRAAVRLVGHLSAADTATTWSTPEGGAPASDDETFIELPAEC